MLDGFGEYFNRDVISDCGIRVYSNEEDYEYFILLNTENISGFTMSRSNEGVASNVPNDQMIISIIRWSSLSNDVQTYLSQRSIYNNRRIVHVRFIVNGSLTDRNVVFGIEKCEIDEITDTAKLYLCNPIALLTGGTTGYSVSQFDSFPVETSAGERAQIEAINKGKYLVVPSTEQFDYTFGSYSLLDMNSTTPVMGFARKNITGKVKKYEDENDRHSINFVGLASGTPVKLMEQRKSPVWNYTLSAYYIAFDMFAYDKDKQYVITSVTVEDEVTGVDATNKFVIHKYQNGVFVESYATSHLEVGHNYKLTIMGYETNLVETDKDEYVKSYTWLDGSSDLIDAQTKTRDYYSHQTYYEFDCRIDPQIEPQDNIYVDGIGVIKVEQLSMTFNGGFKGHIKGRLVAGIPNINAVTCSNVSYSAYTFSFTLNNSNSFAVYAKIYDEITGSYVSIYVGANTSKTVTNGTYSSLLPLFQKARLGNLNNPIYAETFHTSIYNLKATNKTLICIVSPKIVNWEVNDTDDWYFNIKNNNDFEVTMKIYYSGSSIVQYTFTIPAKATQVIDQDNADGINSSVYSWLERELRDDVYCNFTYNQITSSNTILLGENYEP